MHKLCENIDCLHTTILGEQRIKRNLCLDVEDVVLWCKQKITDRNASIKKEGKNWYVSIENCVITVNSYSYTIITAHIQT